jgi:futalosine hydrolase
MRILIVAATEEEVKSCKLQVESCSPVKSHDFEGEDCGTDKDIITYHSQFTTQIHFLITGVGMVATAFALGKHLAVNQYDLVINLGIAGSFDRNITLGDVVEITRDTLSELGADDDDEFLTIDEMGFGEGTFHPSVKLSDLVKNVQIKPAASITVNTVHGNEASIKKVVDRLNPQLESMEGAAVFYSCKQMNIPCAQIRAVSNYVEKRNRDNWEIGLAIKNLNNFAVEFLDQLKVEGFKL